MIDETKCDRCRRCRSLVDKGKSFCARCIAGSVSPPLSAPGTTFESNLSKRYGGTDNPFDTADFDSVTVEDWALEARK